MKKHIPNTLTALNLFSGCIGVTFALKGDFDMVLYCLIASGIFDFFDGTAARLLNVKSNIGKELDSLADVVSFGFLPAMIVYMLLKEASHSEYLPYFAFLIAIFSAVRLAKFNVDERQTTDFIGVNTPMNSFLVISLPFIAKDFPEIIQNTYFLVGFTLTSSYLLVSELKLFSMKLSNLSWASNKYKFSFLGFSVILLFSIQYLALPFIFMAYILFSVVHFKNQSSST